MDHVVIVPFAGAVDAIKAIRPDVYCKGKDYERGESSTPDQLKEETDAVSSVGGKTAFVGSVTHSSTKLMNNYFDHLPPPVKEFCEALSAEVPVKRFRDVVEGFSRLKVLVIGDTIFDRYSYVKVQGLTSKNRIISGRFLKEETQCGGALAVFRHVKQFTSQVKFLSLVGTEPWVRPILSEHIAPEQDLTVRDEEFTTIIKQRFVEPLTEGKELSKLFAVNYIDRDPPSARIQKVIAERIDAEIRDADVVLLTDFGHGMLQAHIRKLVQETRAVSCVELPDQQQQPRLQHHFAPIPARGRLHFGRAGTDAFLRPTPSGFSGRTQVAAKTARRALRLAHARADADGGPAGRPARRTVPAAGIRGRGHHRRGRRLFFPGRAGRRAKPAHCARHVHRPARRSRRPSRSSATSTRLRNRPCLAPVCPC